MNSTISAFSGSTTTPRGGRPRLDLTVDDLRVSYRHRPGRSLTSARPVLDGIDLEVPAGQVHAVIGESGSGKTTLLRALSDALPPSSRVSGRVIVRAEDGHELLALPSPRRRARSALPPTSPLAGRVIGVVPQSAATALTPVRTLGSQLEETCRVLGGRRVVPDLLDQVELPRSAAQLYPHELSGGMAQRAALSLALAGDPSVLLADEPTSALDPALTATLLGTLRGLADDGAAVLLITHDIEELETAAVADRVSVLHDGRIIETGSAAQVLSSPSHPHTRALLSALPTRGLIAPSCAQVPMPLTTQERP